MKKVLLQLMVIFFSVFSLSIAHANLITNGSFENGTYIDNTGSGAGFDTLYAPDNTSIDGWAVTSGSIDWIGPYWEASDGSRSIDMGGNTQGTILQSSINTISGQEYLLTFDMAGNPSGPPAIKTMDVYIDTTRYSFSFDASSATLTNMGWTKKSIIFIAPSDLTSIKFDSTTSYNAGKGPALDNVQLNLKSVPEPATMLLLGFSLLGLVGFGKKFKKS